MIEAYVKLSFPVCSLYCINTNSVSVWLVMHEGMYTDVFNMFRLCWYKCVR